MNTEPETSPTWGIVELMGHKIVAGQIQKSELLGKPMLRVDVPATPVYPAFTQFYGDSAIYCVTFTSAEVAELTAQRISVNPVSVYMPDLITVEQHEAQVDALKDRIRDLQRRIARPALPDPDDDLDSENEDEEF